MRGWLPMENGSMTTAQGSPTEIPRDLIVAGVAAGDRLVLTRGIADNTAVRTRDRP